MDWSTIIAKEQQQPYFQQLQQFLQNEYQTYSIYPAQTNIYKAFELTPYDDVKVVLLGQDPYHNPGQAQGLSFSVPKNMPIPPSLQNIYKELATDLGVQPPSHGDLTSWARQGVLLLNTVLTVRERQANSHKGRGWEIFTDHIIEALNEHETPIVYLLFGKQALAKQKLINQSKHYIIHTAHPSPLSAYRGFFGSHPFSRVNQILADTNQSPIDFENN